VTVSGLREQTFVYVLSGRIGLHGLRGTVFAKLVSGDVEALDLGGDVFMKTVSGDLALAESSADRVFAKSISGSITCDLERPHRGRLALHTASGDITVRVPDGSDLGVAMRTVSGRVTSAFAGVVPVRGRLSRVATGALGGGTGRLSAHTTSGDITLLVRELAL
jgi:DUF4097 and DUF4098 domain-containing protein YvlB